MTPELRERVARVILGAQIRVPEKGFRGSVPLCRDTCQAVADALAPIFAEVKAAAVERCAALADAEGWRADDGWNRAASAIAAAIRAQNKEKP